MDTNKHSLVTVFTSSYVHEVEIVKSLLGRHDILGHVFDRNASSLIGTAFSEGYKLKVHHNEAEKAKSLIEKMSEAENR